jgi:hypothetical protein
MGVFQDSHAYVLFADTEAARREAGVKSWERLLNRPADSLIAEDFFGDGSGRWDGTVKGGARKAADWKAANPRRKLLWSIALTLPGTSLSDVAKGLHDADYAAIASAIAAAQPDAIIRLGWEMNNKAMAWFAAPGQEADYIAAYRRVVGLFKAKSAKFTFDWSTSFGILDHDPLPAYPGDDVVDTIGMDVYDFIWTPAPIVDTRQRWQKTALEGDGRGLDWLLAFGAAHHKKISIGEWGVGLTDKTNAPAYARLKDNPDFVGYMHDWLVEHGGTIAFQIYFDAPPNRIDDGTFPRAFERFKSAFGLPR